MIGSLSRRATAASVALTYEMTDAVDLSIVIPAYNEAPRIGPSLARVREFLETQHCSWEVIVVDDGSIDRTVDAVQEVAAADARVRLVRCLVNAGKGGALRTGVAATRGRRVLMMDADLATPIEEFGRLTEALDAGAQIAVGSRAVSESHIERSQSWLRVLSGRLGNLWIRSLAVPGIRDTQCGFKLFEGDIARQLFAMSRENRFGIDIEILCLARRKLHVDISEVGVTWRHQTGSKVRLRDYFDVLFKVPGIAWSVARRSPHP